MFFFRLLSVDVAETCQYSETFIIYLNHLPIVVAETYQYSML